jgi:hypothetical protein
MPPETRQEETRCLMNINKVQYKKGLRVEVRPVNRDSVYHSNSRTPMQHKMQ